MQCCPCPDAAPRSVPLGRGRQEVPGVKSTVSAQRSPGSSGGKHSRVSITCRWKEEVGCVCFPVI